jgi:hypothetical protein
MALTPMQVNLNGSQATATLSLTPSNGAQANVSTKQVRHAGFIAVNRGNWSLLGLATGLTVAFLLGLPGRRKRFKSAFGLGVTSLLFSVLGCGGGGSSSSGGGVTQPQATTISVASSNAKVPYGSPITISAAITSSRPVTGTVDFFNFGSPIAQGIPVVNNQAQMNQGNQLINTGLYQITAKYNGDTNNMASTSAPLTQVITGTFPIYIMATTGTDIHQIQATVGIQ